MLCSDCSEVVKPIVAVDIDGTLGDYHGHFLNFANDYLGTYLARDYDGKERFRDWFVNHYEVGVDTFRDIKLAYRQGGMKRTMPIYDNAQVMIEAFRNAGAEVWITTTRPYLRLDNIDPDTREWLHRNYIDYDGLLYDKDKYAILASRVDPRRVVAVVDDLLDKCNEAALYFGWKNVIWKRNKYNIGRGGGGTDSLIEVNQEVVPKIKTWIGANNA